MKAERLLQLNLPSNVSIHDATEIPEGETNTVYYFRGFLEQKNINFYLKINKNPTVDLKNEQLVLQALQLQGIPVPRVLFACHDNPSYIALEELPGSILWNVIDPRRGKYDPNTLQHYLFEYGKWLAVIHQLPLHWQPQKRSKLYGFIGEEFEENPRFKRVISYLASNKPISFDAVFVHGDYNTGSVIFDEKKMTGIIDWEFAGMGWKEYDLSWALRARQHFLHSQKERDAILQGYSSVGSYDPNALRWCEVLNYLHFAFWSKNFDPEYMNFALDHAEKLLIEKT